MVRVGDLGHDMIEVFKLSNGVAHETLLHRHPLAAAWQIERDGFPNMIAFSG